MMGRADEMKLEALIASITRADFGDGSPEELRALENYLAAHPEQAELHLGVMAMWDELGELKEPEPKSFQCRAQPQRRWFDFEAHKLAAAILPLLAVLGVLLFTAGGFGRDGDRLALATGIAERRFVTLEDGSTISLGPNSLVNVELRDDERRLVLAKGEAMFEVAHDPQRPFVVAAANGEVQAIGTAFNVRLKGSEVIVTVVEGTIRVTSGANADRRNSGLVQLASAGEQVTYGAPKGIDSAVASDSFISPPREVDVGRFTGWSRGLLWFDGEPLSVVIAEVNRYSVKQLRLLDPELGRLPIYGVLHVGDTDGLLSIVQDTQGLSDDSLDRKITAELRVAGAGN